MSTSTLAISAAPPGQTFKIGARALNAEATGFAEAIAQAYAEHRRPRCLCRSAGIEMYIARLSEGYVVKRMPETGNQHAADCPSFELPAELSGRSRVQASAIVENPISGETSLRLDFPLSRVSRRTAGNRTDTAVGTATTRPRGLSLRGLLHYLWDESELTHWRPSFDGRRSWATVRRHLLRAAENKSAGGNPLSAKLYVPEAFTVEQREQINIRRRTNWMRAASTSAHAQPLMLIVAEVKSIVPTHCAFKAVVKHVPDISFAVDAELYRAIGRTFSQELEIWSASDEVQMIMAATFGLGKTGIPRIVQLCLMPVTRQWLPIETTSEQQLIERLVREGRAFRKVLRYELGKGERIACVALTDRGVQAQIEFSDRERRSG